MPGSRDEVFAVVRRVGPPAGTTTEQWVTKADQESDFRRDVVNGIGCVGYWQICPVNFGWLGVSEGTLRNSATLQFQSAKRVYARQGWAAWNASGGKPTAADIAKSLGRDVSLTDPGAWSAGAGAAFDAAADLVPDNPIAQLVAPLGIIAGAFKGITEWVTDPDTWKRVALVVAGGGIVLVGVAAIAGPKLDEVTPAAVKAATTKGLVK
jgi:hypothetical protein